MCVCVSVILSLVDVTSSKVATLVEEEVFRRAGYGVLKNTSFTVETVLVFVYKLLNNTVAQQTRYVTASQPFHIGHIHTHESAFKNCPTI